jgi:hypothetical protein
MELVRHKAGAPSTEDFDSGVGTPIVLDTTLGAAYLLTDSGVVRSVDGRSVSADVGNAAKTLDVLADETTQVWNTPLSANRDVTLSTTNAYNGAAFHIVRTAAATGAFNLNVGTGPLKALGIGAWCDVEYNGSAWFLSGYGTL